MVFYIDAKGIEIQEFISENGEYIGVLGNKNEKNISPSDISIDKIGAMQSLLELDLEETKALSDNDWKELCSLTNYEAEDLPLDLLNDLMSIFLEKQAF
jgi:hypothetical protein